MSSQQVIDIDNRSQKQTTGLRRRQQDIETDILTHKHRQLDTEADNITQQ
jgi:hypothetical protein